MVTRVKPADLRVGDVLLYHGNALLSRLIRLLDGGDYNHAGIWTGTRVMEALDPGIVENAIEASVADSQYVDVYRFVSATGERLGEPGGAGLDPAPLRARIDDFLAHRERYAYEQLLLLAALATSRRLPIPLGPGLAMVLRNALDAAAEALARMTAAGRQPVICSELVYRCYVEAGPRYFIAVRGADVPLAAIAAAASATAAAAGGVVFPPPSDVAALADFASAAADFRLQYRARQDLTAAAAAAAAVAAAGAAAAAAPAAPAPGMRKASRGGRKTAARRVPTTAALAGAAASPSAIPPGFAVDDPINAAAVPDFVTPRDLQRSPNLFKIGTLSP